MILQKHINLCIKYFWALKFNSKKYSKIFEIPYWRKFCKIKLKNIITLVFKSSRMSNESFWRRGNDVIPKSLESMLEEVSQDEQDTPKIQSAIKKIACEPIDTRARRHASKARLERSHTASPLHKHTYCTRKGARPLPCRVRLPHGKGFLHRRILVNLWANLHVALTFLMPSR